MQRVSQTNDFSDRADVRDGREPELLGLDDLAALPGPLHLAIGVFDGIHLGHREVVGRASAAAAREGGRAAVLTFEPNPIRVIAPHAEPPPWLGTPGQTHEWLAELPGSPGLLPLRFDEALARLEPADFLNALTRADVRTVAVGDDWRFGRRRAGDSGFLTHHGRKRGYAVEVVGAVEIDGGRVSSTRIRNAVRDGRLDEAARLLGRPHTVRGTVVRGREIGREIGFPTANVDTAGACLPPDGVWAVELGFAGRGAEAMLRGVANLGVRPTVDGRGRTLEVHALDFEGDLYGARMDVVFREFIRPERKFAGLEALRARIEEDVRAARGVFERAHPRG